MCYFVPICFNSIHNKMVNCATAIEVTFKGNIQKVMLITLGSSQWRKMFHDL